MSIYKRALRLFILLLGTRLCLADSAAVSGQVIIEHTGESVKSGRKPDGSKAVVWLTPRDSPRNGPLPEKKQWRLVQKNKQFVPSLIVVPLGSTVEFPNQDPFFHNVFSLFDGRRFDLALFQAGTSRGVKFDREGVSYIFCNIHPEMHAVVIALSTRLFAVSGPGGEFNIADVPPGDYVLHIWYERATPDVLRSLDRTINISSPQMVLPPIRIQELQELNPSHKNKFGKDYDRTPPTTLY